MRNRPRSWLLAAPLTALALVLASCGGDGGDGLVGNAELQPGVNDINPTPRDQVRNGGDLRWPLDSLPANFNVLHIDGNTTYAADVMGALMPGAFIAQADSSVKVDSHYFTSIELTSTDPEVVTYTIHPEARWNDGTPITWRDLQAQWQALNGSNDAFQVVSTTGYENIVSVQRGENDKQAVVTFGKRFAEWKSLFSFIYPRSTTTDPEVFNKGWSERPLTTAGPFRVAEVNRTAKTISLVRNEQWWGQKPKLDRIIYRVVERQALADALANGEIDFYTIGSDVNLFRRAQNMQGVEIRRAAEPQYNHITFNGAEGAVLENKELRKTIVRGINRQVIADALIGQIAPGTEPLGNFIYKQGSPNYVDHSGPISYNPQAARASLDKLGWTNAKQGQVRSKGGRELRLRLVGVANNPIGGRIDQLIKSQLAEIGVAVKLVKVPASEFFTDYVRTGNFDMTGFGYSGSVFPITGTRGVYTQQSPSNYSNIGSDRIDRLYRKAVAELDDAQRVEIGQKIDQAIWEVMPQLPLYQISGAYAVRSSLANFGAHGYADYNYIDAGYVTQ